MRLEVPVGIVIGHDICAQRRREEQGKVRGRNDCIRGDGIPLTELVTSYAIQRPTTEKSCLSSDTGVIELSVPEFHGSKSLR